MSSDFHVSPELLAIYLEDARQHLEALDHALLALERDGPDPEVVATVVGPLHTLKGNSGMIGFTAIKDYVHRLEDVFARVRDGALPLGPGPGGRRGYAVIFSMSPCSSEAWNGFFT